MTHPGSPHPAAPPPVPGAPTAPPLDPADLRAAATVCHDALAPALGDDWSRPAGDLAWTCRQTLDHTVDAVLFYAAHLATRATARLPDLRDGDPARSPAELLAAVAAAAAVLAEIAAAAPPAARGYHPAGMADAEGFLAMGCTEILIHTADIAQGLDRSFRPTAAPATRALVARVGARLFPWMPTDGDPWDAFRWVAGRIALPDRPRLAPDWYWQCAPLAEWDGTIKKRPAPPR